MKAFSLFFAGLLLMFASQAMAAGVYSDNMTCIVASGGTVSLGQVLTISSGTTTDPNFANTTDTVGMVSPAGTTSVPIGTSIGSGTPGQRIYVRLIQVGAIGMASISGTCNPGQFLYRVAAGALATTTTGSTGATAVAIAWQQCTTSGSLIQVQWIAIPTGAFNDTPDLPSDRRLLFEPERRARNVAYYCWQDNRPRCYSCKALRDTGRLVS